MTKRSQTAPKSFEREQMAVFKKQLHDTFMQSWDSTIGGKMTPDRFYSGFSHLRSSEDVKAMRDLFIWCKAHKKPFAPIAWGKYAMKKDK